MVSKSDVKKRVSRTSAASVQAVRPVFLRRIENRPDLDRVMDAVSAVKSKSAAWKDIGELSAYIHVEDVQAVPEGIFTSGKDRFTAVATVYATLRDAVKGESFSATESFPAEMEGHFNPDGTATVDRVSVDTSSYYD